MKRSYVFGFVTVLIWATMAAMVKSLLVDIPNLEALSVSSLSAFLFLLIVNVVTGSIGAMKQYGSKQILTMAGLGFIGLFLYSALYYQGLAILTSQEACILNYLWPIMLVLFSAVILKEKLDRIKIAALVCSFIGVMILSSGNPGNTAGDRWAGILCCVAAAACYGLFSVLNKKCDFDQNITMMVIWAVAAVSAAVLGLLTETWIPIRGIQWAGILWLGIVIDAVAYLFWALALRDAPDSAGIANIAYLTPFLSLVISAVSLKERIQLNAVTALLFIIGGIFMQGIYQKRAGVQADEQL